jgi:hypothetical protein
LDYRGGNMAESTYTVYNLNVLGHS